MCLLRRHVHASRRRLRCRAESEDSARRCRHRANPFEAPRGRTRARDSWRRCSCPRLLCPRRLRRRAAHSRGAPGRTMDPASRARRARARRGRSDLDRDARRAERTQCLGDRCIESRRNASSRVRRAKRIFTRPSHTLTCLDHPERHEIAREPRVGPRVAERRSRRGRE